MKQKELIGIDISKSEFDAFLHHGRLYKQFKNNESGFKMMLKWIEKTCGESLFNVEFCFEHTGMYSYQLSAFLTKQKLTFYLVSGLLVKRSMGLKRGKNDKVDAIALAEFAYRHRDKLNAYQMPGEPILKLKRMLTLRSKLVRDSSGYKANLRESKNILKLLTDSIEARILNEMVNIHQQKIKQIEREMQLIIMSDHELYEVYKNIITINGVGPVLALNMIVFTNNFNSFKNWRKFACYAGIAPFDHQSGTSYRGKTKVSSLGNRQIKTLFSLAAATAIVHNPEMRIYYERRLKEGKNKMSTLNIIRNKLLSRIFAVAQRKSPYAQIFKYAA